jgi:hypothetical protein
MKLSSIRFFDKNIKKYSLIDNVFYISIDQIRENQKQIHWENIDNCQILSEDFIREFNEYFNYINWTYISYNQNLSKEFIIEFSDKISFNLLLKNNQISNEVKEFCRIFL